MDDAPFLLPLSLGGGLTSSFFFFLPNKPIVVVVFNQVESSFLKIPVLPTKEARFLIPSRRHDSNPELFSQLSDVRIGGFREKFRFHLLWSFCFAGCIVIIIRRRQQWIVAWNVPSCDCCEICSIPPQGFGKFDFACALLH